MSSQVQPAPDAAAASRGFRDALAVALVIIVAAQALWFSLAAGRGLDLTDEGFYLLTYRYWTEWPSVSLFGAYFAFPFALVGHDVWAMRMLGFTLLLGAGFWFGREANLALDSLAGRSGRAGLFAASIASAAAAWNYYGAFIVPYTPSYNLLTLLCALLTAAIALRLGRRILLGDRRRLPWDALWLGLAGSVGIASKFSAGLLVLALALSTVCVLAWGQLRAARWPLLALALVAGITLNIALLWLADPALPSRFERGLAVALAMMPRNPSGELAMFATVELPNDVLVSLRILLWPMVAAVLLFSLATRTSTWRPLLNAAGVALFVVGAALLTFVRENRTHRVVLLTLMAILLALVARWLIRRPLTRSSPWRAGLIWGAIVLIPFAYSFGTNNPLLRHMGMAAIFPSVLGIALFRRLWMEHAIPGWVFAIGLMLLAALPAEILVRQWFDGSFTYRLGAPLASQTTAIPRNKGDIDVLVSPVLASGVRDYLQLVEKSGFAAGQPMIDFTGQAPGLVALSGGAPLGTIWIVGGPMFAGDEMARISLADVDARDLRRAWLLTSRDSFAAISSWQEILSARLGAPAHEEAARFTIPDPTSADKSKTIEVTLWRPKP
jgi:hypothetical protein